ncbi:hypothetical protein ASPCAL10471 [Aspergillus calidoustus]|uniref:Uncharacterized protein n=1 Tax=Aspergillus calidoustus TaxID=454130 RepID=A0A0U5G9J7_ASPCI|nr:hypothetical protein ASPCAL10471 [Aspergillus calidoustus]
MPHILLLGTLDTKLAELLYLHGQLQQGATRFSTPLEITLIDCGRQPVTDSSINITHKDLLAKYASDAEPGLPGLSRGDAITFLIDTVTKCVADILAKSEIHGILGAGGSGGTSLISAVMRNAAPFGLPKLIVSTIASGDTGPVVGECDITLMYSVVDVAGTNRLLKEVLGNAAGAMFGMASAYETRLVASRAGDAPADEKKTRVGVTMFGVTTPCVDRVRKHLEENYGVEVYVFHATGHGGKAMERLVSEGRLDAILDITTTEICDLIAGGNMACGPSRLEIALKRGIPNIISVGATDMVNFGPMDTVPPKYRDRKLHVHNPTVTLMRTSAEECRKVGEFIVDKVHRFASNPDMVQVWLPTGGVSVIATPGAPFADAEADAALFDTLQSGLEGSKVRMVSDDRAINDEGFAVAIADQLMELVAKHSKGATRQ